MPSDATTVVVNLTVTDSVTGTFVTAYPTPAGPDLGPPNTSSVNVGPLQTTANMVTTCVGAGGMVSIYNRVGTAKESARHRFVEDRDARSAIPIIVAEVAAATEIDSHRAEVYG